MLSFLHVLPVLCIEIGLEVVSMDTKSRRPSMIEPTYPVEQFAKYTVCMGKHIAVYINVPFGKELLLSDTKN